jgi:hypothetical protein
VGGTAVFRVAASGLRPLAYQWYRNGKPIPGAAGATYTFVTTGIPEGGSYQCEVKDKQGRTTRSRPVILIVKPGPEEEADFPQGLSVGAKVGINVSDFYRDPAGAAPSEQQLHFLQAGLGAVWQLRPAWALQADLLFSRKGVIYDFPDHTSAYNLDYLELPLLVRARLGRWMPKAPLCLLLGGYGAALVAAAREDDWDAFKGSGTLDDLGTFDYGAVAGMSWQFGMVSAEWRYALGLAPLDAGRIGNGKLNGVFSFMVGVALFTAQEGER